MDAPSLAQNAVLVKSDSMPEESVQVNGYNFSDGIDFEKLFSSYKTVGFQSTNLGNAIDEINKMIIKRAEPKPADADEDAPNNCTIFLSFTSNLISSGIREILRFLCEHKLVDVIITTAGGVEEDLIKCLAPTYVGDFHLSGKMLRAKGINRIGNLLAPNDNYCKFEDWIMPLFDEMLEEQKSKNVIWTPSKMIKRLGERINDPSSVMYWCAKNDIPVFSPALTDGSIGDMLYFHSYKNNGLILDIIQDIRSLNNIAVHSVHSGMIILGGGLVKHHTCNANLMRNGADYAVYINTANEFDGSDSGARPDEAKSWGKIKPDTAAVKVYAEATIVFPIICAMTFAKHFHNKPQQHKNSKDEP